MTVPPDNLHKVSPFLFTYLFFPSPHKRCHNLLNLQRHSGETRRDSAQESGNMLCSDIEDIEVQSKVEIQNRISEWMNGLQYFSYADLHPSITRPTPSPTPS